MQNRLLKQQINSKIAHTDRPGHRSEIKRLLLIPKLKKRSLKGNRLNAVNEGSSYWIF